MAKMIGVVTEAGPGPNQFMILPNNQIIDFEPAIPGNQGDYIYVSTSGEFTTSDTGKIAFLKVQDAIPTVLTGSVNDPTVPDTHGILLNTKTITFAGTGGANATLSQMVSTINGVSGHNVVASSVPTHCYFAGSEYDKMCSQWSEEVQGRGSRNTMLSSFDWRGSDCLNILRTSDF